LLEIDPGFDASHILASVVIPSGRRYPAPEDRGMVYTRFLDAVRAIPAVENAGTVDALPFSGENHGSLITNSEAAVMEPRNQLPAEVDVVSPDYLQTMSVRLIAGRWFSEDDTKDSSGTAIVNDVAVSRLWPGDDPIGKRICLACTPEKPSNWKRVVGVVSSVRHAALDGPPLANVYVSSSALERAVFLVVRTNRPAGEIEKDIRRAIASVDPNQSVFLSASMRTLIADSLADRRFITSLLAITGCLALVMSIAGVYGVSSYITSLRTQEIGIRIALGATPGNVLALVFREGFFNAAMGLAIGLGFTIVLMRVLRGVLAGLESGTYGHVSIALSLVSLTAAIACWFPARRAAKIEPMSALRRQ
jgi:predicted permease